MTKQKMKFEEYIQLGNAIKKAYELYLKIDWQKPKNRPINKCHDKAYKALTNAKCYLEDLMFFDFPDRATTHVFYGDGKSYAVFDGDTENPETPFAITFGKDFAYCGFCGKTFSIKEPQLITEANTCRHAAIAILNEGAKL